MIGLDNCLRRTVCNKNVGTRNAAHSVSATKLFIYWLFGLMFLHSRTRSKDTEKKPHNTGNRFYSFYGECSCRIFVGKINYYATRTAYSFCSAGASLPLLYILHYFNYLICTLVLVVTSSEKLFL